jgi:hypothetical protein
MGARREPCPCRKFVARLLIRIRNYRGSDEFATSSNSRLLEGRRRGADGGLGGGLRRGGASVTLLHSAAHGEDAALRVLVLTLATCLVGPASIPSDLSGGRQAPVSTPTPGSVGTSPKPQAVIDVPRGGHVQASGKAVGINSMSLPLSSARRFSMDWACRRRVVCALSLASQVRCRLFSVNANKAQ